MKWKNTIVIIGILAVIIAIAMFKNIPSETSIKPFRPETKGLLTLNPIPSADEILDMGFNTLLPFGYVYDDQKIFIKEFAGKGGKIIAPVGMDVTLREEIETAIIGYFLMDEPDCRQISILEMEALLVEWKFKTDKPIGCGFCGMDGNCGYTPKSKWLPFINKLDFVLLTVYPYDKAVSDPVTEMERCYNTVWQGINVPIIVYLQGHWGDYGNQQYYKPDAKKQVKFWKDKGLGWLVYAWWDIDHSDVNNGVKYDKEQWQEAIND